MTKQLFALYDLKAKAFNFPFPADNSDVAQRFIADAMVEQQDAPFVKHAEDFDLVRLGEMWNHEHGFIYDEDLKNTTIINLGEVRRRLIRQHQAESQQHSNPAAEQQRKELVDACLSANEQAAEGNYVKAVEIQLEFLVRYDLTPPEVDIPGSEQAYQTYARFMSKINQELTTG